MNIKAWLKTNIGVIFWHHKSSYTTTVGCYKIQIWYSDEEHCGICIHNYLLFPDWKKKDGNSWNTWKKIFKIFIWIYNIRSWCIFIITSKLRQSIWKKIRTPLVPHSFVNKNHGHVRGKFLRQKLWRKDNWQINNRQKL